ncbi:MAG: hypothetical protein KA248_15155 [Kiritimatiellae bacterium]|nr:hypothetical protein [Kiritimatiellia bacterium]
MFSAACPGSKRFKRKVGAKFVKTVETNRVWASLLGYKMAYCPIPVPVKGRRSPFPDDWFAPPPPVNLLHAGSQLQLDLLYDPSGYLREKKYGVHPYAGREQVSA